MGVRLHFQSTGTVLGQGAPVPMLGPAMTIGRGPENDLCLPDPGKVISKNHCAIEAQGDRLYVFDLSTNGTFLNYASEPLGASATPLNDGDILTIGNYELRVEVTAPETAEIRPEPMYAPPTSAAMAPGLDDLVPPSTDEGGDFLDELLSDSGAPVGHAGVTRDELGEDGILPPLDEDDFLDNAPAPVATGPTPSDHGSAPSDAFRPQAAQAQPIPDDWEDDLLMPGLAPAPAPSGNPFSAATTQVPQPPAPPPQTEPEAADLAPLPDPGPDPVPEPVQVPRPQRIDPFEKADMTVPPAPPPMPAAVPDPGPAPDPAPDQAAATTAAPAAGGDPAARAFLKALGADPADVADTELEATMVRMGEVMAVMVQGLREVLMTRASIKSEFRIQQTVINSEGNNPLKFSISPDQAISALLKPTKGYLPALDAAAQALDDVKAHEVATMAAMDAAVKGLLRQLSPEELEGQLTQSGGLSGLLQGKKARYWDVYEKMYAKISDQAENDFHELFGRAFARAYQDQLQRLK